MALCIFIRMSWSAMIWYARPGSCMTMRGEDVDKKPSEDENKNKGNPGTLKSFNADCVRGQTQGSNGLDFVSGTMASGCVVLML